MYLLNNITMKNKSSNKIKNYYISLNADDTALLAKWRIRVIDELNRQIKHHNRGST